MLIAVVLIALAALAVAFVIAAASVRVLREYERGVVFRLGRVIEQKGPGLVLLIPVVDRLVRVSLRTVTLRIPPQELITRDNVQVRVAAVAYFRVIEPTRSVIEVEDFMGATLQIAQTTLRSVLGKAELDSLLAERERLNESLQKIIDEQTEPWGIKVTVVEIKDVEIPERMQHALARQAEAERNRRAKVINAEGESQAAAKLAEAADVIRPNPVTIQLRYLQALAEISGNPGSTIVFPLPLDLIRPLIDTAQEARCRARRARDRRRGRAGAPGGGRPGRPADPARAGQEPALTRRTVAGVKLPAMTTFEEIRYEVQDRVLTITLHRPDRLNAFTGTMARELIEAFDRADADDEVRAVVVTGEGRAFCAGADLGAGGETFDWRDRQAGDDVPRDGGGMVTLRIFASTKPVIAAINGPAVGVGITMTLPMDVRLAAEGAKIGFVFARRGIVPEACSSWFLPRVVGISQAMEWCATGRVFTAEEALAGGLVRSVHPPGEVLGAARELAGEIAEHAAPVSVALTRRLLWTNLGAEHPMVAHRADSRAMFSRGQSDDAREGVTSFLEKRPAQFSDRVSDGLPEIFPGREEPAFS